MTRECKHPVIACLWAPDFKTRVNVRICEDCDAWLSLGPATTPPAAELLLAERLAEIATLWEPGFRRDVAEVMAIEDVLEVDARQAGKERGR